MPQQASQSPFAPGIAAVRAHWAPFLLIQSGAFALVVAYYQSETVRQLSEHPAAWREKGGIAFAFLAGFVAGGIIAEFAKIITGRVKRFDTDWLRGLLFTSVVYGCVGILVDVLYQAQAIWFGHGIDWQTLTLKTAVDMLLFSTIISIPFATIMFSWFNHRFSLRALGNDLRSRYYRRKVVPGLIPCWAFWTPVLVCTYALPLKLQLPFAILAEAAWSVIFVFIAKEQHSGADPAQTAADPV